MDEVYQPEHPLPDSIKNMSRCETVCRFCGVSYLIHSEIKMLQSELKETKREVERLKEFDTREVLLKNDIKQLSLQYKELTFEYEASKKIDYQRSLFINEKESENLLLNEKLASFLRIINEANLNLLNVKHHVVCDLLILQENLKKIRNDFYIVMVNIKDLKKEISELLEEFKLKVLELKELVTNLSITNDKLKTAKLSTENVLKEIEMVYKQNMIEIEDKKKNDLLCVMEQFKVLSHTNKVLQEAFDTLKLETNALKVENETLKLKNNALKVENETLNAEKNTLNEENKKVFQERFNSLKVKRNILKVENKNLKMENDVLRSEREKLLACQHKIDEMQDYNESMLVAKKINEEMKQQVQDLLMESKQEKQRHTEQLNFHENLRMEVDDQHKRMINDLNECFLKREQKLKLEMDLMQSKCHEKIKMLMVKSEVAQKENSIVFSVLKEENADVISVLKYENDIVVSKLKEEIRRLSESNKTVYLLEESEHMYKRKILELINLLKRTQEDLKINCGDLQDRQQEIKLLQDCVKRECEERFELTEALAKTREELLLMQNLVSPTRSLLKMKSNIGTEKCNCNIFNGEKISKLNKEMRKRCINTDAFDKAKFVISLRNGLKQ